MKRRLLAMVLSLAMLMGLLPTAALAAGSGGPSGGAPYQDLGQREEGAVSAAKFTIYKDGVKGDSPKENVSAGQLSETAPDLTGENLYFDHAEVNGKRVYEAGTLTEQGITYYGSISGALSILGESETIDLYYVSKYPVTYNVTGAEKTAGDDLVKKGDSLTFRAMPSAKGQRLVVKAGDTDISNTGTVFLCQVGTKKILRIYKPFIGGQPPVNGLRFSMLFCRSLCDVSYTPLQTPPSSE